MQAPQEVALVGKVFAFGFCGEEVCPLTDTHTRLHTVQGETMATLEKLVANTEHLLCAEHYIHGLI